jgi:hypothetical protein
MHLTDVASTLVRELRLDPDDLEALKIPVDLLDLFPEWRSGSRSGFAVPPSRLRLLPEAVSRPIHAVRLHVSTSAGSAPIAIALTLMRDLQRAMDPGLHVVTLTDPNTDGVELGRFARVVVGRSTRVRFHTLRFASIYARDNAMAAHDSRGKPVLIVPRAFRTSTDAGVEPLDASAAKRQLGVRVVRSRLYWHGGNILCDGETLSVGADTVAENVTRLGLTRDEVVRILAAELGQPVTVLGDASCGRFDHDRNGMDRSGQASYHIDLDVALLGHTRATGPAALVADLGLGLELLAPALDRTRAGPPYLSSSKARGMIADEYRLAARRRGPILDEYSRSLIALGYRVTRVPQLQTRGTLEGLGGVPGQDFVYCNVLPGLNRGRESVHYTPWGVPRLDAAAERAFRSAGVRPVPVTRSGYLAAAMMDQSAGLRCFCGTFPWGHLA